MDNSKNKKKKNTNSSGRTPKRRTEPKERAGDNDSRTDQHIHPQDIMHPDNRPMMMSNAPLTPNRPAWSNGPPQFFQPGGSIVEAILRFKWTMLIVCVAVVIPLIIIIWTQIIPQYQARAEVRVRPIIPYLVFETEESGKIPLYESFVNTQVTIIKNVTILRRVLDQRDIQQTNWYKQPPQTIVQKLADPIDPLEKLKEDLSAAPRKETEIIDLGFMAASANDAKLILDAVLDQYMKYIAEMSDSTQDKIYRQLVDQFNSLEREIIGREKVAADLRKALGTGSPEELVSNMRLRLDETGATLAQVQQSITMMEWDISQIMHSDSNDVPITFTDTQFKIKCQNDIEWRELNTNVLSIQHQIEDGLMTPNHPNWSQVQKELEFAKELLQTREEQLKEELQEQLKNAAGVPITAPDIKALNAEEALMYLRHQLARARHQEVLLKAEFKNLKAEFDSVFERAQLLEKENTTLQHRRELFSAVRQRQDQKNMERNVPGSIEVLTRAVTLPEPQNDRRVIFTAMALIFALGLGGGAAYLRANMNQAIYTPRDIPFPAQVPLLGHVPVNRNKKKILTMTESIRVVRTALLSRLNGQSNTTILVTSAAAGTGKSTFTILLGKSLAQIGKKVLLIDVDFQKQTMTKRFDLAEQSGFVQSLQDRVIHKDLIYPTDMSGLSFMPIGTLGQNGSIFEEIYKGALKTCMSKLRRQYDFILLDSSPILPAADATILSSYVDGTIMVERENVSNRADIISALTRLNTTGGSLVGTVFIGSGGHKPYG